MSKPIRSFFWQSLPTLVALLALSLPAGAITISISGSFTDTTATDTIPDDFSITNDIGSGADITQVLVDLSTAVNADFQVAPGGFDFAVVLPDDTGFAAPEIISGTTLLTMNFGPGTFTAGKTFDFTIDVDDNNARVDGNNIAGATVTAYFNGYPGTPLVATMVDGGGFDATWSASAVIPEPGTLSMLSLGLLGLAWNGQRAGRRRRQR